MYNYYTICLQQVYASAAHTESKGHLIAGSLYVLKVKCISRQCDSKCSFSLLCRPSCCISPICADIAHAESDIMVIGSEVVMTIVLRDQEKAISAITHFEMEGLQVIPISIAHVCTPACGQHGQLCYTVGIGVLGMRACECRHGRTFGT